jgi:predicted ABC-type ATPase
MYIVAGPPGSGKSTVFPVSGFGVESFNADDFAAQLNGGSYRGIPQRIRARVNRLFESFVNDCIARRASFAVETTLRSAITFDQAATARREGFFIEMHYLALNSFAQHVERVKIRADGGT